MLVNTDQIRACEPATPDDGGGTRVIMGDMNIHAVVEPFDVVERMIRAATPPKAERPLLKLHAPDGQGGVLTPRSESNDGP